MDEFKFKVFKYEREYVGWERRMFFVVLCLKLNVRSEINKYCKDYI